MPRPTPELIIKRLASSRSLRLRILEDGKVVITAPPFLSEHKILDFVGQNQLWIEEKLAKITSQQESLTAQRDSLYLRGKVYQFRLDITSRKKPQVLIEEDKIIVTSPSEDHETVRTILEKWYRNLAQGYFQDRLPLLADLVGKDIAKVTIRSQRTRWGSCSNRGSISLNWRLIMAPDSVSDYVVYHELAHLSEMNHSARFWAVVENYCPNYKEAEEWLNGHHQLLKF